MIISHGWNNCESYIRLTTQIFTEQKPIRKEEMLSDLKINREVVIMLTKEYYKNKYST